MMDEILVELRKVTNKGFGLKVKKSDTYKDSLVIIEINFNSPASQAQLKSGDQIVKVNGKMVNSKRDKMASIINESKPDHLSLVIKRDAKEIRHQSFMNISSASSLVNSSIQTFRNSKSSNDLNLYSEKIFDTNFVPEIDIRDFIQEECHEYSLALSQNSRDKSDSLFTLEMFPDENRKDSDSQKQIPENQIIPVQITRKQAYKNPIDDTEILHIGALPKYKLKKATNNVTVYQKDPVYTVKKKTSSFMCENSGLKNRYQRTPIFSVGNNINSSSNKSQTPSPNFSQSSNLSNDFVEGNILSSKAKPLSSQQSSLVSLINSENSFLSIEVEVKILFFKEKIMKPVWKRYSLEQVVIGVEFQCLETTQMSSSLNCTALNPAIVSADLLMNVWNVNNTPMKFYLPIGQEPYDFDIQRVVTVDEIKITYSQVKVEFLINLIRLQPSISSNLFKLLIVQPPEPKLQTVKHKKSIPVTENIKPELPRKTKLSKTSENELLSFLHKSKKVEVVPLIIIICVTIVEELGIKKEGIYRISGNVAAKKILEEIIVTESPDKWSSHEEWTNVHTTSNLLKSILRKFTLFDKDTAIKLSVIKLDMDEFESWDMDKKLQAIMDMIYHLYTHFKSHPSPDENKCRADTFKYLIKHLYRVSLYHEINKMNAENLATCFVPNLLEDIPSDDDTEYKTSNKNVIHENLKKMVTFWITYADTICELLEETRDDELNKKVHSFLLRKDTLNNIGNHSIPDNSNKDIALLVKERIDYFTENAIGSGYSSPNSFSNINSPDSYFNKVKNQRQYQSVKHNKKNVKLRRNSSGSPIDGTKIYESLNNKIVMKVGVGSPTIQKKSDLWSTKNIRKKKESIPPDTAASVTPRVELISLLISDLKKDVPLVVVACIKIVEKFGIDIDGIYRISGRNQDIMNLDSLVLNNDSDKWIQEPNLRIWANIHNTACLLKKVLKRFCLIPKETWMHMSSQFSEKMEPEDVKNVLKAAAYHLRFHQKKSSISNSSGKVDNDDSKTDSKQCEARLRSGTLRYVLHHLKHVSLHESKNRMTSNSLAVCFVPVLMEEDYSSDLIVINTKCIQIVQLLIDHCDWIFQWDGKPSDDLYGLTMSDSLEKYLANYKSVLCNEIHCNEMILTANLKEVENLLKELIFSSFHFDEIHPNFLRIFFDNSTLSSSVSVKNSDQ